MRTSIPLSNHSLRMPSQSRERSSLKGCGAPAHAAEVHAITSAAEVHADLKFMFAKPPVLALYALRTTGRAAARIVCGVSVKELDARVETAPRFNACSRIASPARKNWISERLQHCGPMN